MSNKAEGHSLTPQSRKAEATDSAMSEGLINGSIVLGIMGGIMYGALKNPTFRKITNVQSRTAIVIMPALFAFGFSSENKLLHRMNEIADETEHALYSVEWAERERKRREAMGEEDKKLEELYRHSILESHHLRIVPELKAHHKVANYVQENPFKVIAGIGMPAIGLIYYGRTTKDFLSTQMRILHTRVFGQFALLCTSLGIMGIKTAMDEWGQYVTEEDISVKVQRMMDTRHRMMDRLEALQHEQHEIRDHNVKSHGKLKK